MTVYEISHPLPLPCPLPLSGPLPLPCPLPLPRPRPCPYPLPSLPLLGIVVKDCLMIMHTMLHGNNSNQALFREASLLQRLVSILDLDLSGMHRCSQYGNL